MKKEKEKQSMKYIQITSEKDKDIPYLISVHQLPEISRYLSINEKEYFKYVTATDNVFYYKVYKDERLAAAIHCELFDQILYMSIVVMPEYQKQGIGTAILHDIQNRVLPLQYTHIKVSIEKTNVASLKLFQKMSFTKISEDEELLNYIYPA